MCIHGLLKSVAEIKTIRQRRNITIRCLIVRSAGRANCQFAHQSQVNNRGLVARSRPKALAVLTGTDESLYHLSRYVVPIELIHLRQPEIVAGVIAVR